MHVQEKASVMQTGHSLYQMVFLYKTIYHFFNSSISNILETHSYMEIMLLISMPYFFLGLQVKDSPSISDNLLPFTIHWNEKKNI